MHLPMAAYIVSILPLALLALGASVAHFEITRPMTGFTLYLLSAAVGIALAVVLAVLRFRGIVPAIPPIAIALAPLVLVVAGAVTGAGYPAINDIATDFDNPPKFAKLAELPENKGRNMDFPAAFAATIKKAYPNLKPLVLPGVGARDALERVYAIAQQQPDWTIRAVDQPSRTIEGTAITRLFRFRDDFVIRITQTGDGAVIDMRSKSRDGKGDLGANATRIQTFLEHLAQEVRTNPSAPGGLRH